MKNRGYIIVTFAALLFVLLGFSALAVDVGLMYSARTSAQRAADAAALAGAFTFIVDPTSPQPATATQHAQQAAVANTILGAAVQPGEVTVAVDTANRRVTVDISRNEGTFLGGVLGVTSATIHTKAYAEASTNSTGSYCVKPWFIPNTVTSASDPCTACSQKPPQVLISGGQVTAFAKSKFGTQITVTDGDPSNALTSGQFFEIQLPGSNGGNDYRNEIGTCFTGDVPCNQSYSVLTGAKIGPTDQGVKDLIGNPPNDSYVALGQYKHADGTISDTSKALIVAPIWDTCNMAGFCPKNQFPKGTNVNVNVIGFAMIFLSKVKGKNVEAYLINISPCAPGAPPTGETGPYSVPLRLVRIS